MKKATPTTKEHPAKAPPTRAPNGYILFSKEHRAEVQQKHPKYTPQEVVSELGKKWQGLTITEKSKYTEKAKKAASKK